VIVNNMAEITDVQLSAWSPSASSMISYEVTMATCADAIEWVQP
jgi:hypothetical protein